MKKAATSRTKKKNIKKSRSSIHPLHLGFGIVALVGISLFLFNFFYTPKKIVPTKSVLGITKRRSKPVCGLPGAGRAHCNAHVVINNSDLPLVTSSPYTGTYGPTQFHIGYNLPCTPSGAMQTNCPVPSAYGPQTIAIVDAYHNPTIENDLNTYSSYYNVPPCTKANGCFSVVNQSGGSSLPTTVDGGWSLEASLDVEVAHAICQTCKILLVETNTTSINDLAAGANTAAALGATAISNSYGASEWPGELNFDSYYTHPGTAVTVSAGDSGYGSEYPASSRSVVAVGGTTLQLYSDSTYATESVWNGTGSGCSLYESASTWQTSLPNWSVTGCGNKRSISDVAADADPNTGAAVYDSTSYSGTTGWYQVGGTSLASPIIAGVYALTGGVSSNVNASQIPYASYSLSNSHDVQSGTNGTCNTIMCSSSTGYDGPTGLGTPNGVSGFMYQQTSTPTPTTYSTPTVIPTPTSTPTPTPKKSRRRIF